jgi:hypothetical protein
VWTSAERTRQFLLKATLLSPFSCLCLKFTERNNTINSISAELLPGQLWGGASFAGGTVGGPWRGSGRTRGLGFLGADAGGEKRGLVQSTIGL